MYLIDQPECDVQGGFGDVRWSGQPPFPQSFPRSPTCSNPKSNNNVEVFLTAACCPNYKMILIKLQVNCINFLTIKCIVLNIPSLSRRFSDQG